jgi:hypothetical protein
MSGPSAASASARLDQGRLLTRRRSSYYAYRRRKFRKADSGRRLNHASEISHYALPFTYAVCHMRSSPWRDGADNRRNAFDGRRCARHQG